MARGSPARITRPAAVARTAVQPSLDAAGRSCESRRALSSSTGTQLMPATSPKWVTCADMAPAKVNENAPRKLARLASRRARRKQNIPSPATAQVAIMLTVHAAAPGKTANSQVSGGRVPAREQGRATPDIRVKQRQVPVADLAPSQHAQRKVLGQVVTGKN